MELLFKKKKRIIQTVTKEKRRVFDYYVNRLLENKVFESKNKIIFQLSKLKKNYQDGRY